jgi:DNA-binding IclR family transcriptional regulator
VATASRLAGELAAHGFLGRHDDRRVRIGVRLWEPATRAAPAPLLPDAAMPFMEGVHDVVGHHVRSGVLDGDDVLFLERRRPHRAGGRTAPAPRHHAPLVGVASRTCTTGSVTRRGTGKAGDVRAGGARAAVVHGGGHRDAV